MINPTQEGQFSGKQYKQRSEHQQKYTNIYTEILRILIERYFPNAKSGYPLSGADFGCGHGLATLDLLQKLKANGICIEKLIGYDISPSQIAEANRLKEKSLEHPEVFFIQQDIQSLTDKNRFDFACAWFTLNWMEDIAKARDNIFQSLKPGGIFIHLTPLEKPRLFSIRKNLLKQPKLAEKFSNYELKPFRAYNKSFIAGEKGYEDIFAEKFDIDHGLSQRGRGIRIFQTTEEFINFLKSWIQELRAEKNNLRILNETEQNEYVRELVESLKKLPYDQDADVNILPDGRIEFHEEYVFACYHNKPQLIHELTFWQQKTSGNIITSDENSAEIPLKYSG